MNVTIHTSQEFSENEHLILLCESIDQLKNAGLSDQEAAFLEKQSKETDHKQFLINQYKRLVFVQILDSEKDSWQNNETYRIAGNKLAKKLNHHKVKKVTLVNHAAISEAIYYLAEGLALGNYQFLKYFKEAGKKKNTLEVIALYQADESKVAELQQVIYGTCTARTLVNEPLSYLTAEQLSEEISRLGEEAGFKVEVFHKKKIESLKMGGLLAVNRGSGQPPTFTILEWKPEKARNTKPYVFVGKGVVYDTGGLSLKPTPNSMDSMKSDMGGAAAVTGAITAIAKAKLPVHVIGLIPATDNRPGYNAYTPGDVIHMFDGSTVEVLNTDAEGRMILADALSYAKRYEPELVIDLATLTGAAAYAIGKYGVVAMGKADEEKWEQLRESGRQVYERLAEFPFWEEYDELIKSSIADIKNIGGPEGGAITAGKFLAHFTDYPWIHLDIAGPAFLKENDHYRTKGGTGVGVRLLFDFIKNS